MPRTSDLPLFDTHIHLRGYHDLRATLDAMEQIAEAENLTGWSALSLSAWDRDSAAQNLLCLAAKALYPRCRAYAGLDHFAAGMGEDAPARLRQVQDFLAMGFDGIKFIESKPSCRSLLEEGLNASVYDPMFTYLEQEQIPIVWHVADPDENWDPDRCCDYAKEHGWFYGDGRHLSLAEIYAEVFAVLDRHPRLNVTFAHLFFLSKDMEEAERVLARYPQVRLDFTPGREMYYNFDANREAWREFFCRHADRLVFGTDNGWGDEPTPADKRRDGCSNLEIVERYLSSSGPVEIWDTALQGMGLPKEVLERIFCSNYQALAGPRRPLDRALALDYARRLREGILPDPRICREAKIQMEDCIRLLEQELPRL